MAVAQNENLQFEFMHTPSKIRKQAPRIPELAIDGKTLRTTPVFDAYWYFAAERHNIFMRRVAGSNHTSLTDDPIIQDFKFTNSFRASDRVSQYLIRNVIYGDNAPQDPENLFFRILMFKLFNKIETWEALEHAFGQISLSSYNYEAFDNLLTDRITRGDRIYSAAYIMPSVGRVFGMKRKHQNHLKLLERLIAENFPARLRQSETMRDGFELLNSAPSFGPFLAYQFITDLNYSPLTNFSEMEFVVAGPGALDGISKCFEAADQVTAESIIQHMAHNQNRYFEIFDLDFAGLWGRPLQLIDCQNIFCEISKYSRVAFPEISGVSGRTRIKQKHVSKGHLEKPWYPPKWRINDKIAA